VFFFTKDEIMKSNIFIFASIMTLFTATLFFAHVAVASKHSSNHSSLISYGPSCYGRGGGGAEITEKDCRLCHEDLLRFPRLKHTNPDKHHLFMGKNIQQPTSAPYLTSGNKYECFSCHNMGTEDGTVLQASVIRDCLQCHSIKMVSGSPRTENVHHKLSSYRCSDCHTRRR
jgi:hypothetical protein